MVVRWVRNDVNRVLIYDLSEIKVILDTDQNVEISLKNFLSFHNIKTSTELYEKDMFQSIKSEVAFVPNVSQRKCSCKGAHL